MIHNIGETIKHLRENNSLTQSELADKILYSREHIARIENGHIQPSKQVLLELSKVFNFDLVSSIRIYSDFSSLKAYDGYNQLQFAIDCRDISKIDNLSKKLSTFKDFKEGKRLQLIKYSTAIVQTYKEKDYKNSIKTCLEALNVLYSENYIELLNTIHLTDTSYYVLILLANNYEFLGDTKTSVTISEAILENFKNIVFTNTLPIEYHTYKTRKSYIAAINNIAHIYFNLREFDKSMKLIEDGINICGELDILRSLPYLQFLKVECLYSLERYHEAQQNYNIFNSISSFTKQNKFFLKDAAEKAKIRYPILFDDLQ